MKLENHEYFMSEALKEAKKAYLKDEVPVGAVVVLDGSIIARAHNLRESSNNFLKHAELSAMEKAAKKLNSWRLENCIVYVTLEPCSMCAGAMIQSRIKKVYYGASDPKSGAVNSVIKLFDYPHNHTVNHESGMMEFESSELLKFFFKKIRK